jgi:hypothetical protein
MHIKSDYLKKRKYLCKNVFFKENISKGVRSTKCPVATRRKKITKYKTLHIQNYIFRS